MSGPTIALTARDLRRELRHRHGLRDGVTRGDGQWVCITEAFSGWASEGGGVDLLALGAWATAKVPGLVACGRRTGAVDTSYPIVAYEIKVSRADFRRELHGYQPADPATRSVPAWPGKALHALRRAHYFVFATPAGLLTDEEISRRERPANGRGLWLPAEAGLIEVTERGCEVRAPAMPTCAEQLPRGVVHELIRTALSARV